MSDDSWTFTFRMNLDFSSNKAAELLYDEYGLQITATSDVLTTPGIISTNAVYLLKGVPYTVTVGANSITEGCMPYIYTDVEHVRTYLTGDTNITTMTIILAENRYVKFGVLLEHAKIGHSVRVTEFGIRRYPVLYGRKAFNQATSADTLLNTSETMFHKIKVRWNKTTERLEIASTSGSVLSAVVYNNFNKYNYSSALEDVRLRHGVITIYPVYSTFYIDGFESELTMPYIYYSKSHFDIIIIETGEHYTLSVFTDGNDNMYITLDSRL